MATVTIKTNDSLTNEFMHLDGISYPGSHIQLVKDMDIRDDDVYLSTYPKSGTHWAWGILQMLRKGSAEYETNSKEIIFLDMQPVKDMDAQTSPRVINCNYPPSLTPKQILEKGIKVVHVQRNPKDVAVSMYSHARGMDVKSGRELLTFSQHLAIFTGQYGIFGFYPWFKYVKEWERLQKQHPQQILTINFEDLKEDSVREIGRMNTFLGCNRSEELLSEIAEACSFQKLKQADEDIKQKNAKGFMKGINFMYRKGMLSTVGNAFHV